MKSTLLRLPATSFALPTAAQRRSQLAPTCSAKESPSERSTVAQLPIRRKPLKAAASAPPQRRSVLDLVSGLIEINDDVQHFETIAGRSAMIGFVVACAAELAAPSQGFFGAWTQRDASVFSALALALVCSSALLATLNKRQLGFRLREAVQASMTALEGSMAGVQGREVDAAVDFVFDTVFNREFIAEFINEDEYI